MKAVPDALHIHEEGEECQPGINICKVTTGPGKPWVRFVAMADDMSIKFYLRLRYLNDAEYEKLIMLVTQIHKLITSDQFVCSFEEQR